MKAALSQSSLLWARERGSDPSKLKLNPFSQRSMWVGGLSPNALAILRLYENSGVMNFDNGRFLRLCRMAQMTEMDMMVLLGIRSQQAAERIWEKNSWPLYLQIMGNQLESQFNALLDLCGVKISSKDIVLAKWVELVKRNTKVT